MLIFSSFHVSFWQIVTIMVFHQQKTIIRFHYEKSTGFHFTEILSGRGLSHIEINPICFQKTERKEMQCYHIMITSFLRKYCARTYIRRENIISEDDECVMKPLYAVTMLRCNYDVKRISSTLVNIRQIRIKECFRLFIHLFI